MSGTIFLPDDFTESLEIEAKFAQGRDGPHSFGEHPPSVRAGRWVLMSERLKPTTTFLPG